MNPFKWFYRDSPDWLYGTVVIGGGLLLVVTALVGIIIAIAKPLSEASCNQKGAEYRLPADYRLLSDTCYVTLRDGRKIDVNQIRGVEAGRGQ